ncbi:unnamed protein product [Mesocestoides corti]|uniref:histone acetyltransferase n=2 Tax=Mesocestoides corti TaxID=53468 RepID=A0A0R3U6V7_MESCO|nr:unnamed protein product [Mesocestoides corti]
MQRSYTQMRDQTSNISSSVNGTASLARKHLFIIRHSMECRQKELDGVPNQCSFAVCAQMRRVLDHVFACNRGNDCTFNHCVTCKQLKSHADNCEDPLCPICSNFPTNGNPPNNKLAQNDNVNSGCQRQGSLTNGGLEQAYQSIPNACITSARSILQPTLPVTNGYNWRQGYDFAKREEIVKSHASQVFPPATYNDCRAEAVFRLFKEQEKKLFNESPTEQDYRRNLQTFVVSLQNELKHKSRINPCSLSNGTVSSPVNSKPDLVPASDQHLSRTQLLASCDTSGKASELPVIEAVNEVPQACSDSTNQPFKQLKTEPSSVPAAYELSAEKKEDTRLKPRCPIGEVQSTPVPVTKSEPGRRCVWTKEQLKNAFIPLLNDISNQEPHAQHFRTPVPFEELKLPDYPSIVPYPMDLSTIMKKLNHGEYGDPWDVVDDFWLMFNNAWRYNRKNSRVYKACSKLAEIFESLIDPLMQDLGFCCGREFVHYPHVLTCLTDKSCNINRDDVYYVYENSGDNKKQDLLDKYIVCERCYQSAVNTITIDDQSSPVHLKKSLFEKQTNNTIVHEKFVNCRECGRKWHKVCACHMDEIWPSGFVCKTCITELGCCRSPNRFTAKRLPTCKLSDFLEKRVNDFLKKKESQTSEVIIRVLASANKTVEVKKYMRKMYSDCGKFPMSFPYRAKVIFAFQELDGQEVCFFGLYVQEYSSDCPAPNKRRVYIAYLDSVYFFQPKQYRTDVYHEILEGYLLYAKKQGFATAHIWACPPGEGDDYIFHMHPPDQKIPKPKRLQDWYRKMLQKAHNERIVADYNNIYQDAYDTNCLTPTDIPYFDGDLWPNTLEELLKAAEESRRKLREEELTRVDADDYGDDFGDDADSNQGSLDYDRKPGSAGSCGGNVSDSKKKTKKRKMKRTTSALSIAGGCSKRKRLSTATTSGDTEAEVQRRLEEMLQRNAEAFLTITLHPRSQVASLQPIKDPDPLFSSELMECRDTFLSRCRERHLEFSTLRRAKFSTLAFLYDIHTENKDAFVYSCNCCQREIESPRQCKQCPNFYLCDNCFKTRNHPHPMEKVVISEDNASPAAVQQSDRLKMERCVKLLEHTCCCRDANCRNQACRDMKRRLEHFRTQHDRNKCCWCRPLHRILAAHSTKCNDSKCQVVFCAHYKTLKKQQESQQRLRKLQTLRRRQKTMQCSNNNKTPQQPNTPQPAQTVVSCSGVVPQLVASTASPTVFHTPNSSEPPHSFSSQTPLTSPHSVSNPRNSPSKSVSSGGPLHTTMQHSHSSPYQLPPQPSPAPITSSKGPGSQQAQQPPYHHLPSPAEYQQAAPVTSPYSQQPPLYQQPQLVHQQPLQSPQMQTKSYSVDIGYLRQNSNPLTAPPGFYENGQSPYLRSPVVTATPRVPYQMPSMEMEESYSIPAVGMKRPFFNECDMMPVGVGGTNLYASSSGISGGKPVMQRSMSAAMISQQQNQQNQAQQQPVMQWAGGAMINGQLMPATTSAAVKITHTGASKQLQPLPAQQTPPPQLGNSVPQLPTGAEVEMVLNARRNFGNDNEFFSWLYQHQHLIPAWNYCRSQQKPSAPATSLQYSSQQSAPQQMLRNSVGFLANPQQQRMMQPGQKPLVNTWPMQNQQQPQSALDPRTLRQTCYAPQGKPAYSQLSQQQHAAMPNNPYASTGFPPRYPSPGSSAALADLGGRSGILRTPIAQQQQRMGTAAPASPRPLPSYPSQQQQPSLMLSQLLVQPHPQQPPPQRSQDHMPHQLPQQQQQLPH